MYKGFEIDSLESREDKPVSIPQWCTEALYIIFFYLYNNIVGIVKTTTGRCRNAYRYVLFEIYFIIYIVLICFALLFPDKSPTHDF